MWIIMGRSQYGTEEIDSAETLKDARYLAGEYRLAFGVGWTIWIKRSK
jgi:hypothetical protein